MSSLVASLVSIGFVAHASAHLSLLSIYGSNNVVGHAFGVNLNGKYPRHVGIPGDAGGDCGVFQIDTDNPSPACGNTPELGPVDIPAWLSQAEGFGLPAAYGNMSVVADAFQVNADGGGPMSCEYNEDATATSWKPMVMILNQAGNNGIEDVLRKNSTVKMQFPDDASCNGGWTKTACIVRCRTGRNKRFGGCFAVKLSSSQVGTVRAASGISSDVQATTLTDAQMTQMAEEVVSNMKKTGLLLAASAGASSTVSNVTEAASVNNVTEAASDNNVTEATTDSNATIPSTTIKQVVATRATTKTRKSHKKKHHVRKTKLQKACDMKKRSQKKMHCKY